MSGGSWRSTRISVPWDESRKQIADSGCVEGRHLLAGGLSGGWLGSSLPVVAHRWSFLWCLSPERKPPVSPQGVATCDRSRAESGGWGPGGKSGDFHWSYALGRPALCLVFPTLKPLGFCSLRKQSSVSHGKRQWLATGDTLSATPTPGARASASMRAKWPVASRCDFPLTPVNGALSSVF